MTFQVDRDYLTQLSKRAYELDDLIASFSTNTAGKRAYINSLVRDCDVDVSQFVSYFTALGSTQEKVALYNKLTQAIEEAIGEEIDAFLNAYVASNSANKTEVNDSERAALIDERKGIAETWSALTKIWAYVNPGVSIEDIPAPKKMTALRGSRGPRAISSYTFSLNGSELPASENKLSKIAKRFTKIGEDGTVVEWKARDLRDYIVSSYKAQDLPFDFKNPPAVFSVTMHDGTVLSARKLEESVEEDDDEE